MGKALSNLCIVTAVDIEFKTVTELLSGKTISEEPRMKVCRGLFGARQITVLQSGMGAVGFAELLAEHLRDNRYDALVVIGLAGGLDPKLRAGDVVLYDLCYDARAIDFGRLEQPVCESAEGIASDDFLSDCLSEALTRSGLSHVRGTGITVSKIITGARDKLSLGARYNAAAVDMETYETLAACAWLNLPAAALRVISDETGRDLPDFNQAYESDKRMNSWRMITVMITSPIATLWFLLSFRRVSKSMKKTILTVLNA